MQVNLNLDTTIILLIILLNCNTQTFKQGKNSRMLTIWNLHRYYRSCMWSGL